MKIRTWHESMSDSDTKDLAYWERNMLALYFADGWYEDKENNYPGWKRVLSLKKGSVTFHIPDDFDTGNLPCIEPNWDGHTTEQKWKSICLFREVPFEVK